MKLKVGQCTLVYACSAWNRGAPRGENGSNIDEKKMSRLRKKTTAILLIAIFMISTLVVIVPAMAKSQSITASFNQAQYQWRASAPYGSWSYQYQNSPTSETYRMTGNVLHTSWSYSPVVTDLTGTSTVYVYDKKTILWIEREGKVTYKYEPSYGDYTIVNFFRGYLDFGGEVPSDKSFVHGVAYQWVYIYAPEDDTGVTDILPHAQWDSTVEAWLVGFSVYLWDVAPQSYNLDFPDPFIEPFPANIYNHLDQ